MQREKGTSSGVLVEIEIAISLPAWGTKTSRLVDLLDWSPLVVIDTLFY